MDILVVVFFFAGLALLVFGADWLVRGASRLASAAGVSSLVIGLTVVACGTSAPEMAVSVKAAWAGKADMAMGNVVGSNIFNVLLIMGLSAMITPLVVARQLVRRDVPLMIVASVVVLLMSLDDGIGRIDGLCLLTALVAYTLWLVRHSRHERASVLAQYEAELVPKTKPRPLVDLGFVLAGLGALVLGSQWLVEGAVAFARWFGVDEVIVGLTIVAAGTSLPEVATSILAAARGERDIAVGNVVGSNLFNLLGVLGLAGSVSPTPLPVSAEMLSFDLPVMIAVAFACLPVFARNYVIPRWQGAFFVAYYVAYTTCLVLVATKQPAASGFGEVMGKVVMPLSALLLVVIAIRVWRPASAKT